MAEPSELLANATPRPWRAEVEPSRVRIAGGQDGRWRIIIAEIDASYDEAIDRDQVNADGALIVAAVNEYEALLEIEAHLRALFPGSHPTSRSQQLLARLDEIRSRA